MLAGVVTILFPEQKIPEGKIRITLVVDAGNSDIHYSLNSFDAGLYASGLGDLELSWDDREFFFMLGTFNIKILDVFSNLKTVLLSELIKFDQTTITVELLRTGTAAYTTEFSGSLQSDFRIDKDNLIELNFMPDVEKLSHTATNIAGNFNDAFGGKYSFDINSVYSLKEVITDFFRIANPAMEVVFVNDWTYKSALFNGVEYTGDLDYVGVRLKSLFGKYDGSNNWNWDFENYLAVLKSALLSLGFFGGMISSSKAVVYNIFDNNLSRKIDIQSLLSDKEKIIEQTQLKYLTLNTGNYVWAEAGTNTGLDDERIDVAIRGSVFYVWSDALSQFVSLAYIQRPLGTYEFFTDFLITYYAYYYLGYLSKRRDRISIKSTNYDISNLMLLDGYVHVPISITKKYKEAISEVVLIPLTIDGGETGGYNGNITINPEVPQNPGAVTGNYVTNEIITPDGISSTFTSNHQIKTGTLSVYLNGIRLKEGLTEDFTITSTQITFTIVPDAADKIIIDYEIQF